MIQTIGCPYCGKVLSIDEDRVDVKTLDAMPCPSCETRIAFQATGPSGFLYATGPLGEQRGIRAQHAVSQEAYDHHMGKKGTPDPYAPVRAAKEEGRKDAAIALEKKKHLGLTALLWFALIDFGFIVFLSTMGHDALAVIILIASLVLGFFALRHLLARKPSEPKPQEAQPQAGAAPTNTAPSRTYVHSIPARQARFALVTWRAAQDRPDIQQGLLTSPDQTIYQITSKLADIFVANPDVDLKKFEHPLGIEVIDVDRPWHIEDDEKLRLARVAVGKASSIVEIEATKALFIKKEDLQQGTPLYDDVVSVFDEALQALKVPNRL